MKANKIISRLRTPTLALLTGALVLFLAQSAVCGAFARARQVDLNGHLYNSMPRESRYVHITPQWSSDGSLILYDRLSASLSAPVIASFDAVGANVRWFDDMWPYTQSTLWGRYWNLSPDGSRIVFTTYGHSKRFAWGMLDLTQEDLEIAISSLDGSGRKRLTKNRTADYLPVWSPDGKRIAFLSRGSERDEDLSLHTMSEDGEDVRRLTRALNLSDAAPPAWSSDGQKLAFLAGDGGLENIYVVDSDGRNMVNRGRAVSHPAWEPNGGRVAFAKFERNSVRLHVVDDFGSNALVTLRRRKGADFDPGFSMDRFWDPGACWVHTLSWSPDGSEIMYGGRCYGYYIVNVATAQVRDLTSENQLFDDYPNSVGLHRPILAAWSPDGSRIAVNDGFDLSIMKREGVWPDNAYILVAHGRLTKGASEMRDRSRSGTNYCFDNSLILWRLIVDCRGAPK